MRQVHGKHVALFVAVCQHHQTANAVAKLALDSALQKLNFRTCFGEVKCSKLNSEQIYGSRIFISSL
jgi:hypothetical protein